MSCKKCIVALGIILGIIVLLFALAAWWLGLYAQSLANYAPDGTSGIVYANVRKIVMHPVSQAIAETETFKKEIGSLRDEMGNDFPLSALFAEVCYFADLTRLQSHRGIIRFKSRGVAGQLMKSIKENNAEECKETTVEGLPALVDKLTGQLTVVELESQLLQVSFMEPPQLMKPNPTALSNAVDTKAMLSCAFQFDQTAKKFLESDSLPPDVGTLVNALEFITVSLHDARGELELKTVLTCKDKEGAAKVLASLEKNANDCRAFVRDPEALKALDNVKFSTDDRKVVIVLSYDNEELIQLIKKNVP